MRIRLLLMLIGALALSACSPPVDPQPIVSPGPPVVVVAPTPLPATAALQPPTAAPAPEVVTYTVQAGDVLGAIADRFGVSVDLLVQVNDLPDANTIGIGQVLIISQGGSQGGPHSGNIPATAVLPITTPVTISPPTDQPAAKPLAFSPLENYRAADYPLTRTNALYTVHYQPDSFTAANIDSIVDFVEQARLRINQQLSVNYAQPFDVYLAGTFFAPPDTELRGRAFSARHTVFVLYDGSGTPAERRYMLTHELTHLIAWNTYGTPRSAMLSEGVAVYAGEGFLLEEPFLPIETFCRAYQAAGRLPRVSAPQLTLEGHLLYLPAYYASGCFVKYLIEQYGADKFGALYDTLDYAGVYGKSLTVLEDEGLAALQSDRTKLPITGAALSAAYDQVVVRYRAFFDTLTAESFDGTQYAELDRRRVQVMQGQLP